MVSFSSRNISIQGAWLEKTDVRPNTNSRSYYDIAVTEQYACYVLVNFQEF